MTSRRVMPRRARSSRPTPRVRTPRQPTTCRSMRRGTAVPASSLGATCLAPMGRSAAVPAPRRPTNRAPAYTPHVAAAPFAPYSGHATTHTPTWFPWCARKPSPTALRTAINPVGPSSRAPSRRCLPWMPYGELHPACFSSQARAAPHSSRTPSTSCARLLACPSHRLTGASAPAAATGQPSTGSAPRSSPEPTNHLNTSPRPP
jgi:hypothetical protein